MTYHGILPQAYEQVDPGFDGNLISAEMLRRQLRLLKAHYRLIAPEDVLSWREGRGELPERAVLLTCDDGLVNCVSDMLPVLHEERVKCLFFVTGASVGEIRSTLWYEELFLIFLRIPAGPFEIAAPGITIRGELHGLEERRTVWWSSVRHLSRFDAATREAFLGAARVRFEDVHRDLNDRNSVSCRRFGLLTCAELKELVSAGMTIGAHTISHPMLSQLPVELAYAEIAESKARLEAALQTRVWAFAYPFGDPQSVTKQVLAMTKDAGFEAAFLNVGGGLGTDLPVHALPRIHVTSDMSLAEFEAHVSGFCARLQHVAGRGSQPLEMQT